MFYKKKMLLYIDEDAEPEQQQLLMKNEYFPTKESGNEYDIFTYCFTFLHRDQNTVYLTFT